MNIMKIMSDFREAMWGLVQVRISDLDFDFLGYANQWVVTPIIPLYVDSHGGSAFLAGLALLALAVPSVVVRPFVGMLAMKVAPSFARKR